MKGRTILQMRRKKSLQNINDSDSSTVPSFCGSNVAGIADPPLYFSRQYSSQRRATSVPDPTPRRISPMMIKIVAPMLPTMVDKETNTEGRVQSASIKVGKPLQLGSRLDDAETFQSTLDVSSPNTVALKTEGELSILSSNTTDDTEKKPPSKSRDSKRGKDSILLKPVASISANVSTRMRKI